MKLSFAALVDWDDPMVFAACDNDTGGCDVGGGCDSCQSGCEGGPDGCDGSFGQNPSSTICPPECGTRYFTQAGLSSLWVLM